MFSRVRSLLRHPIAGRRPAATMACYAGWQIRSRLRRESQAEWIEGAKLLVRSREGAPIANVYCGLEEFVDMALLLHLLRPEDLYVEVGAEEGVYTVLAGRCCGAPVISVERNAVRAAQVRRHVTINEMWKRSSVHEVEVGSAVRLATGEPMYDPGEDGWGLDSLQRIQMVTVDSLLGGRQPTFLRIGGRRTAAAVLEGAARTLPSERLLALQVRKPGPEMVAALERGGFGRWHYDPMERRLRNSPCPYGANDGLFVRDVAAVERKVESAPRRRILGVEL